MRKKIFVIFLERVDCLEDQKQRIYGIQISSSLKISNKNILKNILEI